MCDIDVFSILIINKFISRFYCIIYNYVCVILDEWIWVKLFIFNLNLCRFG